MRSMYIRLFLNSIHVLNKVLNYFTIVKVLKQYIQALNIN